MHFQSTSLIAAFVGLFASAQATIFLGNNFDNNIAWINGENACSGKVISKRDVNPCGRPFRLSNGRTYTVNGCGGTLFILNEDGSFNSLCQFQRADGGCGVDQNWACF
ncbi:hypothetical protein V8F20_008890 [Naviculisporaceae sp. PSN 640]